MSMRKVRGQALATSATITPVGEHWLVPSSSGSGGYVVDLLGGTPRCTCPDYELSGLRCKHIHAVYATIRQRAAQVSGRLTRAYPLPKPPRPTSRQDWPAYNTAQVHEKAHFQALLSTLCRGVEEPEYAFGRPRLPLADMLFALTFKVYSTVSGRRFMTDLQEAHAKGYLSRLPCYNSLFNYFETPALTPLLHDLITASSLNMKSVETRFAVDSSGFSTCGYVRWFDAKYGEEQIERDWVKVHLMCGVTTNIVTAVEITPRYGADYPQFRPLVEATARNFAIEEVLADKAYSGHGALELVKECGGEPYIPFRANAVARFHGTREWDRLYHVYMQHRETFLQHYHQRSLIESTFAMIKAKFGATLRSKTTVAQENELLCKVLCHNLCVLIQNFYELGIPLDFGG